MACLMKSVLITAEVKISVLDECGEMKLESEKQHQIMGGLESQAKQGK